MVFINRIAGIASVSQPNGIVGKLESISKGIVVSRPFVHRLQAPPILTIDLGRTKVGKALSFKSIKEFQSPDFRYSQRFWSSKLKPAPALKPETIAYFDSKFHFIIVEGCFL